MKKLFFLAVFGLLVSGLYAQGAFSGYETDKNTGVAAHVFGASATVINIPQSYNYPELRWIGKAGLPAANDYLSATPTTRTNNIEIGFDFPFAEKTMKYFGLTAGGMVFFGESDALAPAVNFSDQIATTATDYVYFILTSVKSKVLSNYTFTNKSLSAGANTCVRYEKVADTLFIAYENLQVKDLHDNVLTVSFQYAFDKSGKCSFRPVSMSPTEPAVTTGEDAVKYSYWWTCVLGLVAKNGTQGNLLFIKADGTKYPAVRGANIDVTQASHPVAGESYNFVPSNFCKEIASPQVTWAYDVMGTSLILKDSKEEHMTWNAEAKSALFILSRENPLTGANRPQNGTVYADNSTIGTSAFVTTGKFNDLYNRNCFQKGTVENLESSTTFYLYAFPYTEGCGGGPVYNVTNAPMISFRTNYKAPASLSANNVTSTRAELHVEGVDTKAGHYLLAFDTFQLDQQTDMKIDETKTYAAGDKITFGTRQLTILDPCASNATYTLTNLKQGKEYYYYAWSVNAERNWYSRLAARCGVAPVRKLPATINFNAAAPVNLKLENGPLPAGWEEGKNNTYEYAVREVLNRKVLSVQSTGYGVPNPSDPSKLDVALARSVILSPYVNRGTSENVKATIEFVFWALNGNALITSRPKATDVLFVECENADGTWTEIGRVKSTASVSGGVHSLVIPNFMPKETFRFRFTLESTTELPDLTNPDNLTVYYAGISNILIESLSAPDPAACQPAVDLEVVEGSLTTDGVTLNWADENDIAPVEYRVLYKEVAEDEWNVEPINRTRLQLTGLRAGSSYTAMVRTYCTYEDSSELSLPVSFTIPSCGAPASVSATHIMSTSADLSWSGNGQSYAVIYAPRRGEVKIDTLYTQETSVSLTGLIPDMAYSVYVISYCGEGHTSPSEPSEMEYFNTQVVCTAPRIEVVEGSVTWQSVAIAIFDAPSPDGEIYIRSKDTVDYKLEYLMDIKGRDVVKPFGFIDVENITYIVMARSFCEVDTSDWSEIVEFTTLPAPDCGAPSNLQASVDESGRSATVSWTAGENNQSWLLMRKEKDAQKYDSIPNVQDTTATFYGLKPNTIYMWRIQASCDRFLYSTLVYGNEFNTITESNPDCGDPSNLQASVDESGLSAKVSWTAGEHNQSWLLMHKEKDALKYTSREVRTPSFTINDLKPNTVYTWRVQATCANSLYSSLVTGNEFTTAEASLSSTQFADKLRMRVDANQIVIENADGVYIKTLEVISMNGKRLKTYGIHSSDNVLIPHTLPFGPAVFRITGKGGETAVYKLMVK